MQNKFNNIALVGIPRHPTALTTYKTLYNWLSEQGYQVVVDQRVSHEIGIDTIETASLEEISQQADLAIVIGGDGNMLGSARTLAGSNIKVIGVNRGRLGFLTDLNPDNVLQQLADVLNGQYYNEKRFLLEANVYHHGALSHTGKAINEVVFHPCKVAHMIDFEVYIDGHFAFSQRSDGLIISTPTGSTAYSLSAGGPILMPALDAITLVPMFPHTLTSRPLVISGDSVIHLCFSDYQGRLEISCDSQVTLPVRKGDKIEIKRSPDYLNLIHPKSYDYFNTLSAKLGWAKKLVP